MTAAFITATGTDIGKTFLACGLIRHWISQGLAVEVLKPVVSGFDPENAAESDPALLLSALGRAITPQEIARVSPWRFRAPLSPDMAARREGRRIDYDELLDFCRRALAGRTDALLIEGVGGIMVPLDDRHTVLDWMSELRLPVILVAGSYLGTISHTLTALDVLARRNIEIAALVVSESEGATVQLGETLSTMKRLSGIADVIAMPRLAASERHYSTFGDIAERLIERAANPTRKSTSGGSVPA